MRKHTYNKLKLPRQNERKAVFAIEINVTQEKCNLTEEGPQII